ncbi:hypothetical protein L596_016189 [Steinernema carpocapsae]|uniref:Uncharacterized protein n=1 Tax=Steinernema carpocapsae TaxID=34508 RepID=A0A4U5NH96_STECR|nr:hypothetical protein L596_016189 [Steinernema carpocapsae]
MSVFCTSKFQISTENHNIQEQGAKDYREPCISINDTIFCGIGKRVSEAGSTSTAEEGINTTVETMLRVATRRFCFLR